MWAEQKSDRRHRQRNGQHRGVGHHVHPVGVIHAIGEERISAIRNDASTVRQHHLEERLILWIITQLMIKIEPQRRRDEERYPNQTAYGEDVPPGESPPEARASRRLGLGLSCGYDRDRGTGHIDAEAPEFHIDVAGLGNIAGPHGTPAG
ncbi:hypothetical protein [Actinoplanes sp. NPDC089786]|uniref:hypothetical protein n=1 Tax=Actinoplanes sp. NPDC089786 TaxID=3155185 RepID=UPI00342FA440